MLSHLPHVNVQYFSSKGKLPTSVLHDTVMRAGGVHETFPSYFISTKRS
jgi:hypothetical protein